MNYYELEESILSTKTESTGEKRQEETFCELERYKVIKVIDFGFWQKRE